MEKSKTIGFFYRLIETCCSTRNPMPNGFILLQCTLMDHKNIKHSFESDLKIYYVCHIHCIVYALFTKVYIHTIFCYNNDMILVLGIDEFFPKNMFVLYLEINPFLNECTIQLIIIIAIITT